MQQIEMSNLKSKLDDDLKKQIVSGKILLDRFQMIDESSRKSPSYADPNYAGFYYHLGKYIQPESLMEIGFDLGLFPACFLTSCKSVRKFVGFREEDQNFFSFRIGSKNIKKVFKGNCDYIHGSIYGKHFEKIPMNSVDFIIISTLKNYDKQLEYLEFMWQYLSYDGIMVCDNINMQSSVKDAFDAFSGGRNRQPIFFKTRHGTGLLQK